MDNNNSEIDSSTEEERSEVQDDTSVLSDDVLLLIFLELSWEDINNIKFVSRRFYGIVNRNYHRLERRRVRRVSIEYDKNSGSHPFHVLMAFHGVDLPEVLRDFYTKATSFQSVEELTGFLKMLDMKNLDEFIAPFADNLDIFSILERVFEIGTNINKLVIPELMEKDFESFKTLIEKLSSIETFIIEHICSASTEEKDVYSLLSLSSLNNIQYFQIGECNKTKILSGDIVAKLLRNNLNIETLSIGSMNTEFLKSAFKKFFTADQPRKMESECHHYELNLFLSVRGEFENLHDILSNDIGELENVEEVDVPDDSYDSDVPELAVFESIADCKNCPKNRHTIRRCVTIFDMEDEDEEWNH
uniref:F-box domain-containing protein n=1 Tax=Strongyloides papillosus TaxID=174720 RepID=A0A0N5BPJ7_STREA